MVTNRCRPKRHRTYHGKARRDISNRKPMIQSKGPQFRLNPGHEFKAISEFVKRADGVRRRIQALVGDCGERRGE